MPTSATVTELPIRMSLLRTKGQLRRISEPGPLLGVEMSVRRPLTLGVSKPVADLASADSGALSNVPKSHVKGREAIPLEEIECTFIEGPYVQGDRRYS